MVWRIARLLPRSLGADGAVASSMRKAWEKRSGASLAHCLLSVVTSACAFDPSGISSFDAAPSPVRFDAPAVPLADGPPISSPDAAPDAPPPSPDATVLLCPGQPYVFAGDSWYLPLEGSQHWPNAEAECESHGPSHLVVIETDAENRLVHALVPGTFWIGISDYTTEGTFLWVTPTPTDYTNWADGEPNDSWFSEDAGEMLDNGQWNDEAGRSTNRPALCECDGVVADPARFDY